MSSQHTGGRRRKRLSWGAACILPLTSTVIVLTTFGEPSHVVFLWLPLFLRLVLLLVALALPLLAAFVVDWQRVATSDGPHPAAIIFFALVAMFILGTWTTFYEIGRASCRERVS